MLTIKLPRDIEERLDALASRTGRSKNVLAREAIIKRLGNLEDLYLAEKRLDDSRNGRSDSVPLETLLDSYGVKTESLADRLRPLQDKVASYKDRDVIFDEVSSDVGDEY